MSERLVQTVLHPTDFSPASNLAFAQALAIGLLGDTELTILHSGPQSEEQVAWSSYPPVRETLARWGLMEPGSPRSAVFDAFRMRVRKIALRSDNPVDAMVRYLQRRPVDLIVLATEGREGFARLQHPSNAEAVARWSRTKSLFVPTQARRGLVSARDGSGSLKRILVPIDSAPDASAALRFAARTARALGDEPVDIVLLHVGASMPAADVPHDTSACTWRLEKRRGDPVEQILAAANKHDTDLIAMATAGHDSVFDAMRGSTTEQVLRRAPCPVLAVPA